MDYVTSLEQSGLKMTRESWSNWIKMEEQTYREFFRPLLWPEARY
jgi:hypothetical protein